MNITRNTHRSFVALSICALTACSSSMSTTSTASAASTSDAATRLARYSRVRLAPDLSALTENERRMIPLLVDAAKAMDDVFWIEAYGDKESLLRNIADPAARAFAEVNYGPWDRLDENHPFVTGVGRRPPGANYYPANMSKS